MMGQYWGRLRLSDARWFEVLGPDCLFEVVDGKLRRVDAGTSLPFGGDYRVIQFDRTRVVPLPARAMSEVSP